MEALKQKMQDDWPGRPRIQDRVRKVAEHSDVQAEKDQHGALRVKGMSSIRLDQLQSSLVVTMLSTFETCLVCAFLFSGEPQVGFLLNTASPSDLS